MNRVIIKELFLFMFILSLDLSVSYSFKEELLVENLPDSHVHLHFQFTSVWEKKFNEFENYELFPKRIGDIVNKFKIDELKLTLSQGTWKYNKFGLPSLSAPSGSELWTVFDSNVSENLVDDYWIQSSRTISGLFGLSINLIDNPNTAQPKYALNSYLSKNESSNLRYASMPNEIVCTENLTPWIKLLPCGKTKGLAKLFKNTNKLFESHYLSTGLIFKQFCKDKLNCNTKIFELKQTLSFVYNIDVLNRYKYLDEWSFPDMFSQSIDSVCPAADFSYVFMDLGVNQIPEIKATKIIKDQKTGKNIYAFDLSHFTKNGNNFDPKILMQKDESLQIDQLVSIHRYITNAKERNFGVKTLITNNLNEKLNIVYFDTIPWYFRVYINSLKIKTSENSSLKPEFLYFSPGLDRKKPHHMEFGLTLEPKSVYTIFFQIEYAYLKWDEFPPDVNHGFYINSAMISIKLPLNHSAASQFRTLNLFATLNDVFESKPLDYVEIKQVYIYSETLLMNLPTPDFSMPYNVICLTCTVIAIGFGSIHNFTTKKFVFTESKNFKQKIKHFLSKLKSTKKSKTE